MNKHFYRVIFSKTLQRLVVVSDITLSEGKAKSEGVGLPTLFSKVCGWSVKPLMIGLYSLLGAILVPAQAQELQIRADNTVPTNQRPVILETANGIPQVNIQTPE
ncbi:ESPR domain-containing protein [Pelistega suis]|uniref:ESPR domain-containing protein n=1 Tax=Pelistega suis TaxID=1631957 RepID=UPI00211C8A9E|nr:ESPR domain-containing protein [Pelistega suis]MCQ9329374.1 ESPR domain-containing protein [Pelistega suis]